jgi:hypothetical protein
MTIVAILCVGGALRAQGVGNVRINEVLVINEDNYEDDYGHRSSWIEIFNSGYEAVNVSSCYLAVTKTDGTETRYVIPDRDPATAMHAHTYLVFFCEGTDTKGTFYTNFTLDGVKKITLYNADGKGVIDEFAIDPATQRADVSVGYMSADGIEAPKIVSLPRTTPNSTNETIPVVPKSERFRQKDSSGGVMALIAMSVVFSALILIFLVLKIFGFTMMKLQARRQAQPDSPAPSPKKQSASDQVEHELAAAALALKLFQEELHVNEATVITINRASRVYSPWSSKIHGIAPMPRR